MVLRASDAVAGLAVGGLLTRPQVHEAKTEAMQVTHGRGRL